MSFDPGTMLLHYRLVERIGKGGMGEVFVAEDTKLKRKVALKILPRDLAADPERRGRFEREAQAVAALNHPNIVTIHSVEKADSDGPSASSEHSLHFFTMELIDGKPLTGHIPKSGLPLHDLFEIAIPLADALSAAHAQGITHRDLKPDNVMITADGRVKVLDFGLVKLAQGPASEGGATATVTQEGKILGTVSYMSPEQAEGKPVDTRSDVFSLGVLLYQMATGRVPFQGDTPISTITSIMRDHPPSLTDLNQELPRHLDRVVKRCMAKDPTRRYQSALELRNELEHLRTEIDSGIHDAPSADETSAKPSQGRRWMAIAGGAVLVLAVLGVVYGFGLLGTGDGAGDDQVEATPSTQERTSMIVVLPFENLGSADDEYFAVGITEEITSLLARVDDLDVISRKSAVSYAGTEKTTRQIGDELGVDYVLEGTVRWARRDDQASRVRIIPQLIDVRADTSIWSEVYDREMDDVFEIQSDIARQVVDELDLKLRGAEQAGLDEQPTENVAAYQAFLRGNYYLDSPAPTGTPIERAVGFYQKAVELDPSFAEAWARLVEAHCFLYHLGYDVSEERRAAARIALGQAERLAPGSGETHLARGYFHYWGYKEYEPGLEQFRLAAAALPDDDLRARMGEAFILRRLHRFEEALAIMERAAVINPRDAHLQWDLAETQVYVRRYDGAVAAADLSLALQPADNISSFVKVWALWAWKGRGGLGQARDAIESTGIDPTDDFPRYYSYWQLMYEGRPGDAIDYLDSAAGPAWIRQPEYAYPVSLLRALALEKAGRGGEAPAEFREAVAQIEAELERTPGDYRLFGALGLARAGLGRRDEAIGAAQRGLKMMPLDQDALRGPARVIDLAATHARLGEAEEAIARLDEVLTFTGAISIPLLEMDPLWDGIREHPRWRELVKKHG